MQYIYRLNGEYFGFITEGNFFDARSTWLGWVEGNQVWRSDGVFLGEVYENNYILRKTIGFLPLPKMPHLPLVPPIPPVSPVNRMGKMPVLGMEDGLNIYRAGS